MPASTGYTYDAAGNRTSKTALQQADPTPVSVLSQYSYDNIYELTQVVVNGSAAEGYSYDAAGNRLTSVNPTTYSYNASNELTSTSTSTATDTYDNDGNTVSKTNTAGTTSYTWDFENRLTQVTLPGQGGTVYFNYDPFGRRIRKSSPSGTTIYAYDGDNVIQELGGSGNLIASYTQGVGVDEPLAMYQASTAAYFHADGLGSITSLTDPTGAIAASYVYDSFGNLTASTGTITNPFQYTAREFDSETGLYYYRARYYDPQTGRFVNEDPIGLRGGMNFYRYALNNPMEWLDPSGLDVLSFDEMTKYIAEHNLSRQSNELIMCIAFKESSFDPQAIQTPPNTARGLMGVTKGAATDTGYNYDKLADAGLNIEAGSKYLHMRIDYKVYGNGDVHKGVAGYGEGDSYADSILQCEKCLKQESAKDTDCKTKDCLDPLHGKRSK